MSQWTQVDQLISTILDPNQRRPKVNKPLNYNVVGPDRVKDLDYPDRARRGGASIYEDLVNKLADGLDIQLNEDTSSSLKCRISYLRDVAKSRSFNISATILRNGVSAHVRKSAKPINANRH